MWMTGGDSGRPPSATVEWGKTGGRSAGLGPREGLAQPPAPGSPEPRGPAYCRGHSQIPFVPSGAKPSPPRLFPGKADGGAGPGPGAPVPAGRGPQVPPPDATAQHPARGWTLPGTRTWGDGPGTWGANDGSSEKPVWSVPQLPLYLLGTGEGWTDLSQVPGSECGPRPGHPLSPGASRPTTGPLDVSCKPKAQGAT